MNIFVLDLDPVKCAEYHCDKHVIKMTLETAQILCTVRYKIWSKYIQDLEEHAEHMKECESCALEASNTGWDLDEERDKVLDLIGEIPYKKTHENHPSVIWAAHSLVNYVWLCKLGMELGKQYTKRYGKKHKSVEVISDCIEAMELMASHFDSLHPTKFAQAMPEELINDLDPVQAYRAYYRLHKADIAEWNKGVEMPNWYKKQ